jgi:hypothetical protein
MEKRKQNPSVSKLISLLIMKELEIKTLKERINWLEESNCEAQGEIVRLCELVEHHNTNHPIGFHKNGG